MSTDPAFMQLLESAPDAMLVVSPEGRIVFANAQVEKLFGYSKEELIDQYLEILLPERYRAAHVGHRAGYFHNPLVRPMGAALDLSGLHRQGWEFPVEISLSPLKTEEGTCVISAIRDVSERRITEERIRNSLREKEILLKEVHHRVKNNLQIISSIINLQVQQIEDPKMREIFADTRARVRSIALVHERLYESRDLINIEFSEYVEGLLGDLFESYGSRSSNVSVRLAIGKSSLDIDKVVNCGLIVTELVSNSLKYAFRDKQEGEVVVSFDREGAMYVLRVSDNGCGLPKDFNPAGLKSLGLILVRGLSSELGGTVSIRSDKGTEFTVSFPY